MKSLVKTGFEKVAGFIKENKQELLQVGVMVAIVTVPIMMGSGVCEAASSGSGTTAAGSLPWSTGVNALRDELEGPLPRIAGIIAVAVSGAMMAFGEMSGMTKKAMQVTFGLGIAIGAANLVGALSGTSVSGCLF